MATVAGMSAFGQGYFNFSGGKSSTYDIFSSTTPTRDTSIDVAFLWAANGAVPTVDSIMTSTPITGTSNYSYSAAWTAILNDAAGFQLGQNATTLTAIQVGTAASGGFQYQWNSPLQSNVPVTGTAASTAYEIFVIGWNNAYATPAAAEAAGAAVGWSAPFSYTFGSSLSTVLTPAFGPFGVGTVPEPTTLALAGLGGMALMMFRRRK